MRTYITTSIPYVNGDPHLGHALEFVQVDAYARQLESVDVSVRTQSGTDDHALKNVSAASAAGVLVEDLVYENGNRFLDLAGVLDVGFDQFVRTSTHINHAAGVQALWRACAANDDLYQKDYQGLYCRGCEQFYTEEELDEGVCREHGVAAETVTETNWFFRLSKYKDLIAKLLRAGTVKVTPDQRLSEILSFLDGDVQDISVSRPIARAQGWGIQVPDDPSQVVYVWFDALTNYLTGLGWPEKTRAYQTWWAGESNVVHAIGKGIARFHAVYWVAFLLSAELPLPKQIWVHDYLTVNGAKISKSTGVGVDPQSLVADYGQDAVRWWLLREPAYVGTTDYTNERLVARYNADLANTIGNLCSRVVKLAQGCDFEKATVNVDLLAQAYNLQKEVADAVCVFDFSRACTAVVKIAEIGNKYIEDIAPWKLKKSENVADQQRYLDCLFTLVCLGLVQASVLAPFLPTAARTLWAQYSDLEAGTSVFPRITAAS